jgi:hypothetical protein
MEIVKIDNLPVSKASVEEVRSEIARKVLDGEISAVKVQAAIKFYEKVFNGDDKKDNGLNHLIKPYVVDELEKDTKRKDWFGFQVTVGEVGARYSYDNCNDPVYAELMEAKKELDEKIKERTDFLKSIKSSMGVIIEGEAVTLYPPLKTSSTSAKFQLKS